MTKIRCTITFPCHSLLSYMPTAGDDATVYGNRTAGQTEPRSPREGGALSPTRHRSWSRPSGPFGVEVSGVEEATSPIAR